MLRESVLSGLFSDDSAVFSGEECRGARERVEGLWSILRVATWTVHDKCGTSIGAFSWQGSMSPLEQVNHDNLAVGNCQAEHFPSFASDS